MRSRSSVTGLCIPNCDHMPLLLVIAGTIFTLAVSGCGEEPRHIVKKSDTNALDQAGVAVGDRVNPRAQMQPQPPVKQSGPIIGQRTTDIRNAPDELKKGNAQVASTKIVRKDYISLQGNAYVAIIGQTSILSIQHAMDLYQATNDRYPKDYDEFMAEIIKANNIALPTLPPYQKYGYDEKEHKLIILEYKDAP
jgi:hypothetical protein